MIKLLFLAANPQDTDRLRLDEEALSIDNAIRQGAYREQFDICSHWAVRIDELQELLLCHKPDIIHFSGHGSKKSEIILQSEQGNAVTVPADALANLFKPLRDNIRCVVLNACYSEVQATSIARYIDCVVGVSDTISYQAALNFATAFYRALGYGQSIQTAFDLGTLQVDLGNLKDQYKPKLLTLNSESSLITFATEESQSKNGITNIETSGGDFTGRDKHIYGNEVHGSKIEGDQIHTGDIINSIGVAIGRGARATVNVLSHPREIREQRNRALMLNRVEDFWIKGVLRQSLHDTARIELNIQPQLDAVSFPWDMVLQSPEHPNYYIPKGTSIVDVFDNNSESLLILGEPGAGKTTMLLELARHTISRAREDSTYPITAILNLSSWSHKQKVIDEWLVDELKLRYSVPEKTGKSWVENDELLLLLDGLDEVQQSKRGECINAINNFREKHLVQIVVCSRVTDYRSTRKVQLKLQSAIFILPLTTEQVEQYLEEAGDKLKGVREAMQTDRPIKELAYSPLMLSTMAIAYQNMTLRELQSFNTVQGRRRHLFDTYIQQMLKRRPATQLLSHNRTVRWLSKLAEALIFNAQAIMLIEGIQPTWIPERLQRWAYIILARVLLWLILAFAVLDLGVTSSIDSSISLSDLYYGSLRSGLIIGLAVSLVDIFRHEFGSNSDRFSELQPFYQLIIYSIAIELVLAVQFILIDGASPDLLDPIMLMMAFSFMGIYEGIALTVIFVLFVIFNTREQSLFHEIRAVEKLTFRWAIAWKQTLLGLATGTSVYIVYMFILVTGISFSQVSGSDMFSVIESLGTTILFWFLNILNIFPDSPKYALFGALLGAVLGMFGSEDLEAKAIPNQGIRLSFRNGLLMGIVAGIVGAIFGLGLLAGIVAFLWYGGLTILQHYLVRLILLCDNSIPWNLSKFLNYSVERIFLNRVGSGYIFIHRMLMEHFANMMDDDIKRITASIEASRSPR